MTHRIALRSTSLLSVLLTCVALTRSGALQAQARAEAPAPPDTRMLVLAEDQPGDEEMRGANPCRRNRSMERVDWDREAWLAFCVQRARSGAVTNAWLKGLEAYGETLEAEAPARKLAEMEFWLRRLPGKYRIAGKHWNSGGSSPVSGTADCFGIGSGPGASCVISTEWHDHKESRKDPYLEMALHNAMRGLVLLFGIDPGASQVRATLVDFRAVGMSGLLDDGVVMLSGRPYFENNLFLPGNPFGTPLATYSWTTTLVATKPDGDLAIKFLVTASDVSTTPYPILFDLQLHREPLVEISRASEDPDAASVSGAWPLVQMIPTSPDVDEEVTSVDLVDIDSIELAEASTPDIETDARAVPKVQRQLKRTPGIDSLDEVSITGDLERQRRAQSRGSLSNPDVVTVTRKGKTQVRLQPFISRNTISFRRESVARLAPQGMSARVQLRPTLLTAGDGSKIRDITLDFAANIDEPDGLPALIPFGQRTSLINLDHVRLDDANRTITKVTNAIHPQTRRCAATLGLADNGDNFRNRFVLLGDRLRDCEAVVRERHGDLFFADEIPQRLRQDLSEIYDPIYSRFSGLLGSEPGLVFVAWRTESPSSDFRFARNWGRSIILLFNGSGWQQGITSQQRESLADKFATEQIVRRLGWQDERNEFTQSAMNYLLNLNKLHDEQATVRRLTIELPEWIANCARDLDVRTRLVYAEGDVSSYNCGLVLQFVYDAVARAQSKGNDTIYNTWRGLLTDSYDRGKSGVEPGNFIAASGASRRIVQGLMDGSMDWRGFVEEMDKFGVRLNLQRGESGVVVEVVSLAHFRD